MPNVLITGADRGLGLSLCKEFLRKNWTVFAGKFMEEYHLLEDLQRDNENLHILPLDMSSKESILAAAGKVNSLDMLISNAALMAKINCKLSEPPLDTEAVWQAFNVNALGVLQLVRAFLPLMGENAMRRLCFVSSEVSSIALMKNRFLDTYAYPMSKAAMNMGVRLMHNDLFPQGFTFRLFHPGWMKFRQKDGTLADEGKYDPDFIGERAAKYFLEPLPDEHRLVMVDFNGYEWPF